MQSSDRAPITFRPRITLVYEECPALWEVFESIPSNRHTKTIMAMLNRLVTLERLRPDLTVESLAEPEKVVLKDSKPKLKAPKVQDDQNAGLKPSPEPVVEQDAAGADENDISLLFASFGDGGLESFLGGGE